jgi:multicomponent Na+:H+ antiporter subunit E
MTDATHAESKKTRLRSALQQLPLLVVLVLLWILLWGAFTWLNLVTGIVLGILVMRVFYLPPVELSGRFNLGWFLVFLGRFIVDLVVASVQVATLAVGRRSVRRNSIIAVQLLTRSDFIMTITAIALSLIPGSFIVEVDRDRGILYLHVIDTAGQDDVDRERTKVLAIEARVVRALGSRADLERLER